MSTTTDHDELVEIASQTYLAYLDGKRWDGVTTGGIMGAVLAAIEPAIAERERKAKVEVLEELVVSAEGPIDDLILVLKWSSGPDWNGLTLADWLRSRAKTMKQIIHAMEAK